MLTRKDELMLLKEKKNKQNQDTKINNIHRKQYTIKSFKHRNKQEKVIYNQDNKQ